MNIFEFEDSRKFLRKYLESQPKRGRGEIGRIAKFVGIHPSLLSQILSGDKSLSLEQAQLVCEYLGLTNPETEYFLILVQFGRAGTVKLKSYFKEKLVALKSASIELSQRVRQDRELSEIEKSIFYSHWYFAAVWLFTSLGDGQTVEDISKRFEISRERSTELIRFLTETGLCVAVDGRRFKMGPQSVHLERGSAHLPRHHTNWRLRAIEASDKIDSSELMYTAPISVSRADFKVIRARLADVIKEFTDVAIHSEADEIAYLGMDFFWIRD